MSGNLFPRAILLGLAIAITSSTASANAADYEFQPVTVNVKNGVASQLVVRLIHKPTGKPVSGAVLFRTRLDMSPDQMEAMTAKHAAVPAEEPGLYRFKADLTMAGGWALRIMAKIQGETETVQATVIFQAKD